VTGATAKAPSLGTPGAGVCSLAGHSLLEIPTLACLLGWDYVWGYPGRRYPRWWRGAKDCFQSIQGSSHAALACKTVSLQQTTWKKEGGKRWYREKVQYGPILLTMKSRFPCIMLGSCQAIH